MRVDCQRPLEASHGRQLEPRGGRVGGQVGRAVQEATLGHQQAHGAWEGPPGAIKEEAGHLVRLPLCRTAHGGHHVALEHLP